MQGAGKICAAKYSSTSFFRWRGQIDGEIMKKKMNILAENWKSLAKNINKIRRKSYKVVQNKRRELYKRVWFVCELQFKDYASLVPAQNIIRIERVDAWRDIDGAWSRWGIHQACRDAIFLILFLSVPVVCGVGADVAYHGHVMGLYVTWG